ncbi:hypothetical protein D3C73_889330 [compost metagenome]
MISPHNRRIQPVAADVAPADNRSDRIAVRTGPLRAADKAGNPVIRVFRAKRQHRLGRRGAVHGGNDLQQVPVAKRMQQLIAVMMQREGDGRVRQRHAVHGVGNMPQLRLYAFHIFQPCRSIVK